MKSKISEANRPPPNIYQHDPTVYKGKGKTKFGISDFVVGEMTT